VHGILTGDQMDLDKHIDDFVHYLLVIRDLTKSTAIAYTLDVKTYILFFESEIDGSLESFRIEPELIHKYLYFLKKREMSGATIQRRLIGLSRFWSFLYRCGISSPPISLDDMDIKVKNPRNPVKPLGEVDYQRMITGLDHVFVYAKKFHPFTG
jgi:site-specific recombinase XerD